MTHAISFDLDSGLSDRFTRRRLFIAMVLATALMAALLSLDVDPYSDTKRFASGEEVPLTVHLKQTTIEQKSGFVNHTAAIQPSTQDELLVDKSAAPEISISRPSVRLNGASDSTVHTYPARGWHANSDKVAKESVDDQFRRENVRASMWRQSRSIMFRASDEFVTNEEEPVLADINFRQPVGVLGLGITIGSCFIGIPLAGVPVEERSIAITLFVCRNNSG